MLKSLPLKLLPAALGCAALVAAGGVAFAGSEDPLTVETAAGTLRGTTTADHRSFQGIPYATPPVGDLRWRATEPAEPWSGVRDASEPGAMCPQIDWTTGELAGSEDCLYLNVDAPAASGDAKPVIVFVHGGGFIGGQGADYDPTRLVEQSDAVVVTVNYRVGALGFLAHPGMDDPYAGNFALADQQQALRWVEENIAAFGGDPGNVTLWGQSAGGFAVCGQLASPAAAGLFDKAIIQSATCAGEPLDAAEAADRGEALAADLGCTEPDDALECLRRTDLAELVEARMDQVGELTRRHKDWPWFPVSGTEPLPDPPLEALRDGAAADVPIMHGSTRDETTYLVNNAYDGAGHPVTAEEYPGIVEDLFGPEDAPAVLALYPPDEYDTPSLALTRLLTDYGGLLGTCSQLPSLEAAAMHAPVYAYEFAEPVETAPGEFPLGAVHGSDLPYLFETRWQPDPPTGDRKALADTMIDHWGAFARTGDPGGGWEQYRHDNALAFSVAAIEPIGIAEGHHCGFWIPRL